MCREGYSSCLVCVCVCVYIYVCVCLSAHDILAVRAIKSVTKDTVRRVKRQICGNIIMEFVGFGHSTSCFDFYI